MFGFVQIAKLRQKVFGKVKLAVFEQIGFSLYSFLALALIWTNQEAGLASKELSTVSALHLSIPFLALTFGWAKSSHFNWVQLLTGRQNIVLTLVTVIWAWGILWGLAGAISGISAIAILVGAFVVTGGGSVRWLFLSHGEYAPLILASLVSAAILVISTLALRGLVDLPLLVGFVFCRVGYLAFLFPFFKRLPSGEKDGLHLNAHPLTLNKAVLALMQYLRQNGAISIAAFFIPETALLVGRVYQLFGSLVRMAMTPIGNLLFFSKAISRNQFVLLSLVIAACASITGIAMEALWLETGSIVLWIFISLSAFLSYTGFLACRVLARPNLALVSESLAAAGMILVLATQSKNPQTFAYAIILADVLAATTVYSKLTLRKRN